MSGLASLGGWALSRLEPETAHNLTLRALELGLGPRQKGADPARLATDLAGLPLSNPFGLAAGFDKDARAPGAMLAAGLGFVECGTTTPRPQAGNPRPRLFRLRADGAVINRMGFNNAGCEVFAERLGAARQAGLTGPVGANIGANKDSADRAADYAIGLRRLWPLADYFTLNVSSPNTPGLRDLQQGEALEDLLGRIAEVRDGLIGAQGGGGRNKPVFLKIAPDMSTDTAQTIAEAALRWGLSGLIVSNTTLDRPASLHSPLAREAGGLSGAPLFGPSTALLAAVREAAGGRLTLIGAGGVASGADAYAKIRAGASAVQLYTALALQGPGLIGRLKRDLEARLAADGFASVAEAAAA